MRRMARNLCVREALGAASGYKQTGYAVGAVRGYKYAFMVPASRGEPRRTRGRRPDNAEQKECTACNKRKLRVDFSRNQWERTGPRRCAECITPKTAQHNAAADSLLRALESLPTDSLRPYSARLQALLVAAEGSVPPALAEHESPIAAVLLDSQELLMIILSHANVLAPMHREHEYIVGWTCCEPTTWDEATLRELKQKASWHPTWLRDHQRRLGAAMLVCKHWYALNTGERGLQAWKTMETAKHEAQVAANCVAAADPEYPWLYRLCAMSASNDVVGLRAAIGERPRGPDGAVNPFAADDHRWGSAGLRDAVSDFGQFEDEEPGQRPTKEGLDMWEADKKVRERALKRHGGGWRTCPAVNRGEGCIFADPDSHLDLMDIGESGNFEDAVLAVCLLNAAMAGAVRAAELLLSYSEDLWWLGFNQKGDRAFSAAIEYACERACLEAPVRGVEAMLSQARSPSSQMHARKQMVHEEMHRRVRGSNGSALHLAAARGHEPLVRVLLEAGMRRSHLVRDSIERRGRNACTAEVWAQKRGYKSIVELLRSHGVAQAGRPVRLAIPTGRPLRGAGHVQFGTLVRFEVSRGFGFIRPDLDSDGGSDESDDDDYGYGGRQRRRSDDIFVHLDVLRAAARGRRGYPQPAQRVVFRAEQGHQGLRASLVADAEDGSFITLPLPNEENAQHVWLLARDDEW